MNLQVVGVVSGKGGVGKTTTVVNLSAALMQFNKKVIAVDADIKMSGLGLQLGMYYFPVTLNDVLKKTRNIFEALYIHSSGLRIIPASLCMENVGVSRLKKVLNDPFLENSIVLVDAPPGLEKNAIAVLKACKKVLIVTEPELPAISDVFKIIAVCKKLNRKPIGIIVNKYRERDSNQINVKEIESVTGLPVIGVIPEDRAIKESIFKREPVVFSNPYSSSAIAFKKLAANLIGEEYIPEKSSFVKRYLKKVLP